MTLNKAWCKREARPISCARFEFQSLLDLFIIAIGSKRCVYKRIAACIHQSQQDEDFQPKDKKSAWLPDVHVWNQAVSVVAAGGIQRNRDQQNDGQPCVNIHLVDPEGFPDKEPVKNICDVLHIRSAKKHPAKRDG